MLALSDITSRLPKPLADKFASDPTHSHHAISAVRAFEDWFSSSGTPFFKHYTDHSIIHSIEVFQTAIDLCSENAFDIISAVDLSVLLLACIVHDCGMHLTERQFLILIELENTPSSLDETNWKELWEDYFQQAQRFNARTLLNIFGDTEPVRRPPKREIDFTDRDRLLVGEFLRRHHPRIAHEICLGLDEILGLASILSGFSGDLRDLIGLIARSHGVPIRSLLTYVDTQFHRRDFQGVHTIYCMCLLRISDYLQIQAARAPEIHGKIHNVRSPISAREWRVHQSIRNIHHSGDDPEAIYISSSPHDVADYSRVKTWLVDLQNEIDTCWAVLGEIYGRHQTPAPLSDLQFRLRRIRSNILDRKSAFDFIPEEFSFKVAEAEMLGLLLGPLYGDHPYYGIRELVQNARDATLERGGDGSITIAIDASTSPPTVKVSDNGVGMSLDVIRSYFLNAGASYRNSEEWKGEHTDVAGRAKVSRSGRFGVGALAAFLLGDRINVSTRHRDEKDGLGYEFTSGLQDRPIQIVRCARDIGTEITVFSTGSIITKLERIVESLSEVFQFDDIDISVKLITAKGDIRTTELKRRKRGEKSKIVASTRDFTEFELHYQPHNTSYSGRHGKTFINGIGVASVDSNDFRFGSNIYRSRNLTHDISLPGHRGSSDLDPALRMQFYVEDRDAFAQINLARTQITNSDDGITDIVDAHLYQVFNEELASWKNKVVDDNRWTTLGPVFRIDSSKIFILNGEFYPVDRDIAEVLGVKSGVRLLAPPKFCILKSLELPNTAIMIGRISDSVSDGMSVLRDQRTSASGSTRSSSLMLVPDEWANRILRSNQISNWMSVALRASESVTHAGKTKRLIQMGMPNSEMRTVLSGIAEGTEAETIEVYFSASGKLDWSRWARRSKDEHSVFFNLWSAERPVRNS